MSSVLQPWVMGMGWKMQSILLSGLRGPDRPHCPKTKAVGRWLRRVSQNNADPSKDYMRDDAMPTAMEICDELEFLPAHFVHHLADALRVVGIYHPDKIVRDYADAVHYLIAEEIFHFVPEFTSTFIARHADKVAHE